MRDASFAPAAEQRESVRFSGRSEIEHDGVILLGARQEIGLLAVGGAVDRVSGFGQRFRQLPGQENFVLYDQNPQLIIYNAGR